jgi:hypothetical protein
LAEAAGAVVFEGDLEVVLGHAGSDYRGMVASCQLPVASCRLRVASCQLRVASWQW